MKTITFGIPTYNRYESTVHCIESIRNVFEPTDIDYKIIVCDDVSDVDQYNKLEQYIYIKSGIRARLIKNDVNKGPGGSRNHIINEANTDYICFIDSDDEINDKMLEMYKLAVAGDYDFVIPNYTMHFINIPNHAEYESFRYPDGYRAIMMKSPGFIAGSIAKLSLYKDNNLYAPSSRWGEDMAISFLIGCLSEHGKCKFIHYNDEPYVVNIRNTNTTSNAFKLDKFKDTLVYLGMDMRFDLKYLSDHGWDKDESLMSYFYELYGKNFLYAARHGDEYYGDSK